MNSSTIRRLNSTENLFSIFVENLNSTEFLGSNFPVEFGILGVDEFTLGPLFCLHPVVVPIYGNSTSFYGLSIFHSCKFLSFLVTFSRGKTKREDQLF